MQIQQNCWFVFLFFSNINFSKFCFFFVYFKIQKDLQITWVIIFRWMIHFKIINHEPHSRNSINYIFFNGLDLSVSPAGFGTIFYRRDENVPLELKEDPLCWFKSYLLHRFSLAHVNKASSSNTKAGTDVF